MKQILVTITPMSDLHTIQKSLADWLSVEYEEPNATYDPAHKKRAFRPISIALMMFAFAAIIVTSETIL